MTEQIDLNWCSRCGGALTLIDGTDPREAAETGEWHESYQCKVCDGTGTYNFGPGGESATGVVA